jgi:hypothetical protein
MQPSVKCRCRLLSCFWFLMHSANLTHPIVNLRDARAHRIQYNFVLFFFTFIHVTGINNTASYFGDSLLSENQIYKLADSVFDTITMISSDSDSIGHTGTNTTSENGRRLFIVILRTNSHTHLSRVSNTISFFFRMSPNIASRTIAGSVNVGRDQEKGNCYYYDCFCC